MRHNQTTPPPSLLTLPDEFGDTLITISRQWPAKRRDILQRLAPLLDFAAAIPPVDPQTPVQVDREDYIEQRVGYRVEIGRMQAGTLFLPRPLSHRQPAVLCCAGNGNAAATLGKELAKRKFVALLPDEVLRSAQDDARSAQDHAPEGGAAARMLWDHQRGLDYLCHLDAVDSDRLAAIGQGLGGMNAILLAAFDHRIKASAAACAYEPFAAGSAGALAAHLDLPEPPPFAWVEVLALIAPRAFHYTYAMKDDIFPHAEGVREDMVELGRLYDLLGCRDKFDSFESPEGHGYPTPARREAFAVFKRVLQEGR